MVNVKATILLVGALLAFWLIGSKSKEIGALTQTVAQGGVSLGSAVGTVAGAPIYGIGAGLSSFTESIKYALDSVNRSISGITGSAGMIVNTTPEYQRSGAREQQTGGSIRIKSEGGDYQYKGPGTSPAPADDDRFGGRSGSGYEQDE